MPRHLSWGGAIEPGMGRFSANGSNGAAPGFPDRYPFVRKSQANGGRGSRPERACFRPHHDGAGITSRGENWVERSYGRKRVRSERDRSGPTGPR